MKMKIGYFYPTLLNLYGDDGNVQILEYRAEKRGIEVEVSKVGLSTNLTGISFDLIFMGGGPDSSQKDVYKDLVEEKGKFLREHIEAGKVGLYICGSYQLLGNYYKSADGSVLDGLGIFDLHTINPGKKKPRCIGMLRGSVCRLCNRFEASSGVKFLVLVNLHRPRLPEPAPFSVLSSHKSTFLLDAYR